MRKLVISDIHGAYKALIQVLERAKFDPDEDQLIFLGDVCDGWGYTTECIEYLSALPNLVQIMGNHDAWTLEWLEGVRLSLDVPPMDPLIYQCWVSQGGQATINSIRAHKSHTPVFEFLLKSKPYHIDGSLLFTHGGLPYVKGFVESAHPEDLMWDRTMVHRAREEALTGTPIIENYGEVFVGHTPTLMFGNRDKPINYSNVWMIDTGASYNGPLSVMDAVTKEVWQSDPVVDLYPGEKAR